MPEQWTPPAFDDVSTTELVTAAQLNAFGNSLRFLKQVAYTAFTSNVSVTATTAATAVTVVSAGALTYEAVAHEIFFASPKVQTGTNGSVVLNLWDDTTDLGIIGEVNDSAGVTGAPVHAATVITPTAASHTYIIKAWRTTANGTVVAGLSGIGNSRQGYIRIVRIPT